MPWQDHFTRDDLIERIRRLAGDHDLSHKQVAEVIGHGVTANIVSGLANRAKPRIVFGKARREARLKPVVESRPQYTGKGLKFVILDEVEAFDPNKPAHESELQLGDKRCRFPLWPHRLGTTIRPQIFELFYCGKPVVPGTSWCPDCTPKIYEPGKSRPTPADGRRTGWQYGT